MARRKAFVHIGLPGTGGAFLGAELAHHADELREQGVCTPARSTNEMFRAALEMRRDHKVWGYRRRDVEGVWAGICRRAFKEKGTVVVSHELLAACTTPQIALLLDGLAGLEVHVVVTAQDPATQVVTGWADTVDSGSAASFGRFRRRIMDPAREHEQAQQFWAAQALDEVLERWGAAVRDPRHVHVVPLPADSADPRPAIWRAVGELAGFDAAALPLVASGPSITLDGAGTSVLREVNDAIDGRLGARDRAMVSEFLPREAVSPVRASVPADLYDDLLEVAERWAKQIADGGYDVLGATSDLLPERPADDAQVPDHHPVEERLARTTDALADVLVEVARLREHAEDLEERNAKLEKKKRKLKRRLADATLGPLAG
ncbi:hypothetical protein [Nocardioides sp. LS1]|uniref:hypothetical protein n=1 Tax=Nocardioides sp. LS1 TaxID=1027620 RepID=UPI000F61E79D|nr:hypothetical protein [Nocardioides sp. LS1]GCD90457.1 hypothetical protein NLS1_24630 [Nocardioides sp. LS1]